MVYFLIAVFALLLVLALFLVPKLRPGDTKKPISDHGDHGEPDQERGHHGKAYYYGQVDSFLKSGQTQRALYQANRNIAYHPDDPVAYINRARVYEALGATKNAILDLKEALRIAPDNREARSRLDRLSEISRHDQKDSRG